MRQSARALVVTAVAAGALAIGGGAASAAEAPQLDVPGVADLVTVDTISPIYDQVAEGLDSDLLREGLSGILFG